jgi:hypothetical protein
MEQIPSSEADSHPAGQLILRFYETRRLITVPEPAIGPYPKSDESSPRPLL